MGNQTIDNKPVKLAKPSELDKFRLFYEFVADDTSIVSSKNAKRRTIRLTDSSS